MGPDGGRIEGQSLADISPYEYALQHPEAINIMPLEGFNRECPATYGREIERRAKFLDWRNMTAVLQAGGPMKGRREEDHDAMDEGEDQDDDDYDFYVEGDGGEDDGEDEDEDGELEFDWDAAGDYGEYECIDATEA
jgi:hypothetical protein